MEKSIKEQIIELKKEKDTGCVNFFNDGKVTTDDNHYIRKIDTFKNQESIDMIKQVILGAAEYYARDYEYDSLSLELILGLVYKSEDVREDNRVKFNRLPINNLVRYYTGSVKSFYEFAQTNDIEYNALGRGRQGYLHYNEFVEAMENEGIEYDGPKTFDEFVEAMSSNLPFDISLNVDLREDKKLTRKM